MPRPRRKSHLAHRRSAAAESTRRHCRFCGESACTVAVAVAASSSGAAAGEEGVQTTPTLGVFPTKCCRPPPRPISHFLSASVFLKRQKQGPGRGEAGPRSRTGSRPARKSKSPSRHSPRGLENDSTRSFVLSSPGFDLSAWTSGSVGLAPSAPRAAAQGGAARAAQGTIARGGVGPSFYLFITS